MTIQLCYQGKNLNILIYKYILKYIQMEKIGLMFYSIFEQETYFKNI